MKTGGKRPQFHRLAIGLFFILIVQNAHSAVTYGTCGAPALRESILESGLFNGGIPRAPGFALAPVPPVYQIGEQRKFYAFDQQKNSDYTIQAACRAVGEKSYIFVESGQNVLEGTVLQLQNAFEGEGAGGKPQIYEAITRHFGPPPDELDADPRIYILILDIRDAPNQEGASIAGYFDPVNQYRDAQTFQKLRRRSNEVEIVYLDANFVKASSQRAQSTLAHEFTHLVQWARDPGEATWVAEGTAVYAEALLGYNVKSQVAAYEKSPDTPLRTWQGAMANYGASYLFFAYLAERYGGVDTIGAIVANPSHDVEGIRAALARLGQPANFAAIFSDWVIANYLDNPALADGRYGYQSLDVRPVLSRTETQYPIDGKLDRVNSWASNYLKFTDGAGSDLTATLSANQQGVVARLIKVGSAVEVSDVPLDTFQRGGFIIPQFGTMTKEVILVVSFQPSNFLRRQGSYTYSVVLQPQTEPLAVSPASKWVTTWGRMKKE